MKKKPACERVAFLTQLSLGAPDDSLAALYSGMLSAVAAKSVVRLDPRVKRNFCKKCRRVRKNWRVEDKSKAGSCKFLKSECVCGSVKRWKMESEAERPAGPSSKTQSTATVKDISAKDSC